MKKKIVVILSKWLDEYSGPSLRTKNLIKDLSKDYSFNIISSSSDGIKFKWGVFLNSPYFIISFLNKKIYRFKFLRLISRFAEITLSFIILILKRPDLIHILGRTYPWESGLIYCKVFQKPLILEFVHENQPLFLTYNLFFGKKLRIIPNEKKTLLISISNIIEKELKQINKKLNKNIAIWNRPNPIKIDLANIKNKPKSEKITLGYLAKFKEIKNQKFLIDVLVHLPEKYVLLLIGPTNNHYIQRESTENYLEELRSHCEKLNLLKRVKIIPGYLPSEHFYPKIDIFLNPSLREGLGTTIIESIFLKKKLIANKDVESFRQHIIHSYNGFLLELDAFKWSKYIRNYNTYIKKNNQIKSDKIFKTTVEIHNEYKYWYEQL